MRPSHESYRPDIDGLRAIAIALVVAYHAFPNLVPGGFIGVDVFFVVSGFLISGNIYRGLEDGSFSMLGFYGRRCRRIVPALVVVLIATTAVSWAVLRGIEFTKLGRHLVGGATFTSNIVLIDDVGYFNTGSALKPFLHLWSLGIEEQFYLLWPIMVVLWNRLRLKPVILVTIAFAASFAINERWAASYPSRDFYLLPSRFWELLIGCGLAAVPSLGAGKATVPKTILGIAMLAIGVACIDNNSHFPGPWALLPTGAAALAISAGPDAWWNRWILSSKGFVFTGRISYPLYLWHWPLLAILRATHDGEPGAASKLAILLISVVLATVTWRWLERPTQSYFSFRASGFLRGPLFAVLVSGGILCGIAATGLLIYKDAVKSRDQLAHPFAYTLQRYENYDNRATRPGTCFVDTWFPFNGFDRACFPDREHPPAAILIGDSLAASIYPGLSDVLAERGVQLSQLNASSCPPIIGLDRGRSDSCRAANEVVFRELAERPPALVIIEANWVANLDTEGFAGALRTTLEMLERDRVTHIVVLGPIPPWTPTLPRMLEGELSALGGTFPAHTRSGLDLKVFDVDAELRRITAAAGATYISLTDRLCDATGCIVLVGPDIATDLIVYDNHHLTLAGSRFIARSVIAPQLGPLLR